jgi:RNA polymerase sigma factor (TIGR02999 family)
MDQITSEIPRLLRAWKGGDSAALERLIPMVYDELHRVAHRYMRREKEGVSLQTTALVNEAYLRLVDLREVSWNDRAHFIAVCANLMRRFLVDAARARMAGKRGGKAVVVELNESIDGAPIRSEDLICLDKALEALARFDARKARVVELRFFGGLTVEETAKVMKISPESVKRDWKLSRAWLHREMRPQQRTGRPLRGTAQLPFQRRSP